MVKKTCDNCGQVIGDIEEFFLYKNRVVCKACKSILLEESEIIASDSAVTEENTSVTTNESGRNVDEKPDVLIKGRMNRAKYFVIMLVIGLPCVLMVEFLPEAYIVINIFAKLIVAYPVVKRLHDMDKSGYLYLLTWIPLVSLVIGLMLLFCKGTDGPNKYGEDPLAKN